MAPWIATGPCTILDEHCDVSATTVQTQIAPTPANPVYVTSEIQGATFTVVPHEPTPR